MASFLKVAIIAAAFLSVPAYAAETCPVDRGAMYFTGNTKVVNGTLLKEYRCAQGHTAWSR